ncbi:MAG TPA: hypothetical protein PLL30_03355 [Candidatus Krumholzibacteria bacterium]|nr:hypothetical protein [Candidatus Krumholzibacteria bacterium]HPD70810.1 hypothetical protein [Candidatus Krumholzibacteria bacterium]HRY39490.1 hypothetical protein [Candidatus Krumholzibacteria bacterium]
MAKRDPEPQKETQQIEKTTEGDVPEQSGGGGLGGSEIKRTGGGTSGSGG